MYTHSDVCAYLFLCVQLLWNIEGDPKKVFGPLELEL